MNLSEEAREARNAYMREWKRNHRDKCNRYQNKWRSENPDKVAAYNREYWERKANADYLK